MHQLQDIFVTLSSIMPGEVWLALIGGPVSSIVAQKFKKWFSVQKEKVIVLIVFLVSFIEAVAIYIVSAVQNDPSIIGQWAPIITASSIGFYHLIGKPIINVVNDAKLLREQISPKSKIETTVIAAAGTAVAAGILPAQPSDFDDGDEAFTL